MENRLPIGAQLALEGGSWFFPVRVEGPLESFPVPALIVFTPQGTARRWMEADGKIGIQPDGFVLSRSEKNGEPLPPGELLMLWQPKQPELIRLALASQARIHKRPPEK